jgi:glycosyltransferase involved in cell wall biosynthesis
MTKSTVAFLTFDWSFHIKPVQPNGCAWYRCYLPMSKLDKHGWEAGMGVPGFNEKFGYGLLVPDKKVVHGWDIIVLKLLMLKRAVEDVQKAQELGQKIVVDVDDFMEGLAETNMAYHMTDPKKHEQNNREHYFKIIELADALIVSTPFLQKFYKEQYPNKPVYVIRNSIDYERYVFRTDHAGRLPNIGWVGATPWRSNDLEQISGFLNNYLQKNRIKFHHSGSIIGSRQAWEMLGIDKKIFTHEPMQPILDYPKLFRKIDIGIVPLNDLEFNHAKSFVKGLEYAAAGVPFVASPLPAYIELAKDGVGRIAHNDDEWMAHFDELMNPKVRKEEREKNLEIIKEKHSVEARASEWDRVLKEIIEL